MMWRRSMKKYLHYLTILLLITTLPLTRVQAAGQFSSGGQDNYLKLLEEVFKASENSGSKDFFRDFSIFWNDPQTTSELKNKIIEASDLIMQKKGKAYPDFNSYLLTVQTFVANKHPQSSFDVWHSAVFAMLKDQRSPLRHLNKLNEHVRNLLNESILYSTAALKWTSSVPDITFEYTDALYARVSNTTITCRSQNDSIFIYNTSGMVNLMSGVWSGNGGKVTWEQSGLPADRVYATFGDYKIEMSRNTFEIENVEFRNSEYFNYPLQGRIQHRLMQIRNPENSTYPKFESYEQRYQINNIQPNFNFEGGFSQHGSKFIGSGNSQNPAVINIFRNDTLFITAKSEGFILRKDQIVGSDTEITMYLDDGYIYHPGLLFKYMAENKELHLIRDGNGLAQSPFFNTYHNISMDAGMIKWQIGSPGIELRMITGAAENHAFFESISYFREEFFYQLQGMDAIHPLQGLLNCSRAYKTDKFTARDYARFLNMPEHQIRQQVIGLSFHGFVGYNVTNDTIEIRDRLRDYLAFRAGTKDYDVIRFKSETPGSQPNAVLDLKNYDMELNGVSAVSISDRQNVVFFPTNKHLTLKKDRNFGFDGSISSGLITLFGNSFEFDYKDFRINLNIIDSMSMNVQTESFDYYGRPAIIKINNTVAQLSGYLEIDKPDNKSGKEEFPEYPRLTSNTNSYVYYDNPAIQGGKYNRESFYFMLDPFEIDSLSQLTKKNITFTGVFKSNIFPDFEETLTVRPDYSLGFVKQSPSDGYTIYGKDATFSNTIDLSNDGLKGKGSLNWLTGIATSDEFTFLPDRAFGLAEKFEIAPAETGIEYPDVSGTYVTVNYFPFEDHMDLRMQEEPFTLYAGETSLEGNLILTPNGLEGDGSLVMPNGVLKAKNLQLGHHVVMADSSDFSLTQSSATSAVNFKTENLLSTIDFKERKGSFMSRDSGSKVEFTDQRYIAFISQFSWDMDNNSIYLGLSGSKGNRFVSTHRRQDSLDFIVPIALYDVEAGKIYAKEVKEINVADARMILNDGNVTINRDAVLDVLDSVRIILNDTIHSFYNARVSIEGKMQYQAQGLYDFTNGDGNKKTISFNSITVSKEGKTSAEGVISEKEFFSFNKHFGFKGQVGLSAGKPLLKFKGGAQMLHDCHELGPQDYVKFESEIDPSDVRIPLAKQVQNIENENIFSSIYLNRDSNIVYSAFMEDRLFHSDVPILPATGILYFDKYLDAFTVSDASKLAVPDTTGNILRFSNSGCYVSGFGRINMGLDLGSVSTMAAGFIKHNRAIDSLEINSFFTLDFFLEELTKEMVFNGIVSGESGGAQHFESAGAIARMAEIFGKATATDIAREVQGVEEMKSIPVDLQYLIAVDDLNWTWSQTRRSYIADSEAYVAWIGNKPVNRKVIIKAEIAFSRAGNSLDFYIEPSKGRYYYFSYRNGVMNTRSSDPQYNAHVQALKPEDRRPKTRIVDKSYYFTLAPESRLKRFLSQIAAPETPQGDAETEEPTDE